MKIRYRYREALTKEIPCLGINEKSDEGGEKTVAETTE